MTDGERETETQQVEHADKTRDLEDQTAGPVHVPAVPQAAPPALRVPELRLLQQPRGGGAKG